MYIITLTDSIQSYIKDPSDRHRGKEKFTLNYTDSALYKDFLKQPLREVSQHLLHSKYTKREQF
ncbi:MAG: iron hydrogenase small subunit [Bacteroidetes bacterium]|nr:iron hydrogenase small subunit [Bacteroidota bacterium]